MRVTITLRTGIEGLAAVITARRMGVAQFWWIALVALLVAPTVTSLGDLMLFLATGDGSFAPVDVTSFTSGADFSITAKPTAGPLTGYLIWLSLLAVLWAAVLRLHDTGRSAGWLLLLLVPIAGWFVLIVWWTNRSDHGPNRFGPQPAARPAGAVAWLAATGVIALCIAAWIVFAAVVASTGRSSFQVRVDAASCFAALTTPPSALSSPAFCTASR